MHEMMSGGMGGMMWGMGLVGLIVLVLAVSFAEAAVDYSEGLQILELGGASALVIVALTVFVRFTGH